MLEGNISALESALVTMGSTIKTADRFVTVGAHAALSAGSGCLDINTSTTSLTRIGIGVAIDTTDGATVFHVASANVNRAGSLALNLHLGTVGVAGAEVVSTVNTANHRTVGASSSTRGLAGAFSLDTDTSASSLASILIGNAVETADWCSLGCALAHGGSATTSVLDLNIGALGLALVSIGLIIDSANRREDLGANASRLGHRVSSHDSWRRIWRRRNLSLGHGAASRLSCLHALGIGALALADTLVLLLEVLACGSLGLTLVLSKGSLAFALQISTIQVAHGHHGISQSLLASSAHIQNT